MWGHVRVHLICWLVSCHNRHIRYAAYFRHEACHRCLRTPISSPTNRSLYNSTSTPLPYPPLHHQDVAVKSNYRNSREYGRLSSSAGSGWSPGRKRTKHFWVWKCVLYQPRQPLFLWFCRSFWVKIGVSYVRVTIDTSEVTCTYVRGLGQDIRLTCQSVFERAAHT